MDENKKRFKMKPGIEACIAALKNIVPEEMLFRVWQIELAWKKEMSRNGLFVCGQSASDMLREFERDPQFRAHLRKIINNFIPFTERLKRIGPQADEEKPVYLLEGPGHFAKVIALRPRKKK